MNTLLRTLASLALGPFYVFRPMASRFRSKKIVKCPSAINLPRFSLMLLPVLRRSPKKNLSRSETVACGRQEKGVRRVALSNRVFLSF
jgi:hypothetical protein